MKLKSHSGTKKRVKRTGTGKLRFQKSHRNHLLGHKSKRQKKFNKFGQDVSPAEKRTVERLLPYA